MQRILSGNRKVLGSLRGMSHFKVWKVFENSVSSRKFVKFSFSFFISTLKKLFALKLHLTNLFLNRG
jgi:hypothetical protein